MTSLTSSLRVSRRYWTRRSREPGDIASTQISIRPVPPAVRSCTPFERTVKLPSSMYQTASASGVRLFRYSQVRCFLPSPK